MIDVFNEVGRLRRVLMHEPGAEVDLMVPAMMEELLYDDILFGSNARDEHRLFRGVLDKLGVETLEIRDLLTAALGAEGASDWILGGMAGDMPRHVRERMTAAAPDELASMLVCGIRYDPVAGALEADDLFELPPLPNFCFQRDPQVILGNGVAFCPMATATRWREALLSRTVFKFHPDFAQTPVILDPTQPDAGRPLYLGLNRPSFEGGDVMILSEDVVVVGYSERSNRSGVRQLARALADLEGGPRWLIVVKLPHRRAYMHLDTLFTVIGEDECLVYPPVIQPGSSESAHVFEFDLHAAELRPKNCDDLLSCLKAHAIDLRPVPCGGQDPINQAREQWTDGANALAVAPGVIVLYDRNVVTAETLSSAGYRVLDAVEIRDDKALVDLESGEKVCILMPSNEISRARGGPMP
jgi:arginine deiminase